MSSNKIPKMAPSTILLIGGLITVLITYLATRIQEGNGEKDHNSLLEENKNIKKQLEEANYYITGGNGFCYVEAEVINDEGEIKISVKHSGKYPLQGVEFFIMNTDYACLPMEAPVPRDIEIRSTEFRVSSIISEERKFVGYIKSVPKPIKHFNLRFRGNNREWFQRIVITKSERVPNHYHYVWATQVYKIEKEQEVILKQGTSYVMDTEFVLNSDRSIRAYNGALIEQVILKNIWSGFPLNSGDTTPWDKRCKIRFGGNVVSAEITE